MHFCLDLTHHPWTRPGDAAVARSLALAEAADHGGAEAIWVSEDPEGWDAFAVLGALAARTKRITLGTGVANPYARHPNTLAAAVATIDRLSAGRAALGFGRGQPEWHRDALGVEIGSPLTALEETIRLLRAWWTPPHRASADKPFRVVDWERTVQPAQPAPPIYLAAAGPRALDLAGRLADGVIFNNLTSDAFLGESIPAVRASAAAAGRDADCLAFILRTPVTIAADPAPVYDRAKTSIALINALPGMDRLLTTPGFDLDPILAEVRRLAKTEETLAAGGGFPALRRAGDLKAAKAAIPTELVAQLTIAGSLPHVRARLRTLADLGITHVSVEHPGRDEPASALVGTLRTLRAGLLVEHR